MTIEEDNGIVINDPIVKKRNRPKRNDSLLTRQTRLEEGNAIIEEDDSSSTGEPIVEESAGSYSETNDSIVKESERARVSEPGVEEDNSLEKTDPDTLVFSTRHIKVPCQALLGEFLWGGGSYDKGTIYFCPLQYPKKSPEWTAFIFSRYHEEAVEIIRGVTPESDRFFYQEVVNRFKRASVWCVRNTSTDKILAQMRAVPGLALEPIDLDSESEKK